MATEKPTATKVSQVAFAVESVSLGCVALTLVPGALLALLSADFLFGLGVVAVIVGFSGLAVALWILGQKVIQPASMTDTRGNTRTRRVRSRTGPRPRSGSLD